MSSSINLFSGRPHFPTSAIRILWNKLHLLVIMDCHDEPSWTRKNAVVLQPLQLKGIAAHLCMLGILMAPISAYQPSVAFL